MADIGDVFTKTLAQEKAAAEGRKKREIAEQEKALIEKSKFKEYLKELIEELSKLSDHLPNDWSINNFELEELEFCWNLHCSIYLLGESTCELKVTKLGSSPWLIMSVNDNYRYLWDRSLNYRNQASVVMSSKTETLEALARTLAKVIAGATSDEP